MSVHPRPVRLPDDPTMRRVLLTFAVLLAVALPPVLLALLRADPPREEKPPAAPARVLPGLKPGGTVQLPNQWSLRPAGRQVALGDFPVNLAPHPDGRYLAALHAGFGEHEVVILDLKRTKIVNRASLDQTFYGLCFSPDGRKLYASGAEHEVVYAFDFKDGYLSARQAVELDDPKEKFVPAGIATDADGRTLYVAGALGHAVRVVPLDKPKEQTIVKVEKEGYPYACLPSKDGKRLFVSLWAKASVAVIDLAETKVTGTWETEKHPTEMALSPDGKTLYVACSNSTKVSVL